MIRTSVTLGCALCATFLSLPHFDVLCDLLLNRHTATRNLFVKYMAVCWLCCHGYHYSTTGVRVTAKMWESSDENM